MSVQWSSHNHYTFLGKPRLWTRSPHNTRHITSNKRHCRSIYTVSDPEFAPIILRLQVAVQLWGAKIKVNYCIKLPRRVIFNSSGDELVRFTTLIWTQYKSYRQSSDFRGAYFPGLAHCNPKRKKISSCVEIFDPVSDAYLKRQANNQENDLGQIFLSIRIKMFW